MAAGLPAGTGGRLALSGGNIELCSSDAAFSAEQAKKGERGRG